MNSSDHILKHTFGFDHYRPNQKEIIDCLMAGRDCFDADRRWKIVVLSNSGYCAQLKLFLKQHENEAGIIYCFSRNRVEELSNKLKENGYSAIHYHAGMTTQERNKAQDAFQKDDVNIMVATIAWWGAIS